MSSVVLNTMIRLNDMQGLTGTSIQSAGITLPITSTKLLKDAIHLLGLTLYIEFGTETSAGSCELWILQKQTKPT